MDKDKAKALSLKRRSMPEGWMEQAKQLNAFAWWCFENEVDLEEADTLARKGVDLAEVRRHILDAPGVIDCHDLHAWTITSGSHVVSAHVVMADGADPGAALDSLTRCLCDDFDIEHSTFQLESADRRRLEQWSHA